MAYEIDKTKSFEVDGIEKGPQNALSGYVMDYFEACKTAMVPFQEEWAESWRNFLGQYTEATKWKKTEGVGNRSRVFIKLTALKCHTAHSKIMDASFIGNRVPFSLSVPQAKDLEVDSKIAEEFSRKFKEKIDGHFELIEAEEVFDGAVLELCILGSAVIKGPIIEKREKIVAQKRSFHGIPAEEFEGFDPYELVTETVITPVFDTIPLWEYYVDPNAKKNSKALGEIHFQRLLPGAYLQATSLEGYDKEAVRYVFDNAQTESTDQNEDFRYVQLADYYMGVNGDKDKKISVLEYWGQAPVSMLKGAGVTGIPEDKEDYETIECVVVLGGDGTILKACVNPIGSRVFKVAPYKKRPHCIFGQGVPYAMKDSQMMINSAARLLIDNKSMSALGMLGVNTDRLNLKRTRNLDMYAGKTWYLKGSNTKLEDAIGSIKFPDVTSGLRELIEMFVQFADDETALPKFTHGSQGSFLNKTARGMSMLMTQAHVGLKSVMRNIDNHWIEDIVEGLALWFKEFDSEGIFNKFPVKVKALGMNSLVANEIQIENLMSLLQAGAAPQDAIFIDRIKMFRSMASKLEVPDVIKTDEEIDEIMKEMQTQAEKPKDLRELIRLDRLYPELNRVEQIQILDMIGVQAAEEVNAMNQAAAQQQQQGSQSGPPSTIGAEPPSGPGGGTPPPPGASVSPPQGGPV